MLIWEENKMQNNKIKTFRHNPNLEGQAFLVPDVVFSTATGVELKMQTSALQDENWPVKPKKAPECFLQAARGLFQMQ